MLYLVKWANYPDPKDFTWEPKEHLETVKKMLEEFEAKERNW